MTRFFKEILRGSAAASVDLVLRYKMGNHVTNAKSFPSAINVSTIPALCECIQSGGNPNFNSELSQILGGTITAGLTWILQHCSDLPKDEAAMLSTMMMIVATVCAEIFYDRYQQRPEDENDLPPRVELGM